MNLSDIENATRLEVSAEIGKILSRFHTNGPVDANDIETLSLYKQFHPEWVAEYEGKINSLLGLFYKPLQKESLIEEIYSIYSDSIKETHGRTYTPVQAEIVRKISRWRFFSFSAPTSAGKSHLLRTMVQSYQRDIVIVVPSRALIAEYFSEVIKIVGRNVLVLQFIENIYTSHVNRRIYIVTPERAVELFKYKSTLNVGLIIMDEAQISEEPIRGLKFDAFFRRTLKEFPVSKKVFSHPFITNPEAQLSKHDIQIKGEAKAYKHFSVGKIFLMHDDGKFYFFSPFGKEGKVHCREDLLMKTIGSGGAVLIYVSKKSIYDGSFKRKFSSYIGICRDIVDPYAISLIEELREYIGASYSDGEKHSNIIDMMKKGIVVHHGSMPLKARLTIEKFVRHGSARICFATSTLGQGINMPFDIVWVDNFNKMDNLTLKNLIGRAGRSRPNNQGFDFGYTVINKGNVATFSSRLRQEASIKNTSLLDEPLDVLNEDQVDLVDAIRTDSFNDSLHLPEAQVERIRNATIDEEIEFLLNAFFVETELVSADVYNKKARSDKSKIKAALKKIYVQHLRRQVLTKAESSVLSAAIPILLWRVQGKSFSEIVSLRYSYLTGRDEKRRISRAVEQGQLSIEEGEKQLASIGIRHSQVAFPIPDVSGRAVPLFSPQDVPDYDRVVYDSYDYLDKVVSISLADPLCAAFDIYFQKWGDTRARDFSNIIRYGTSDEKEIWMLKYGIDMEDIEWLKEHVGLINETTIEFSNSLLEIPVEKWSVIDRYL
ncbi:MAG: DEAD/DEAH box helicase [Gammaproteobacteria bacterium]|nr:DEAD/DEAH box helicase [Gammaproteobacteria bacterium]MDP2349063.1 DEAD/DEAH box helicase [Gammaproteobacteria bacterium]